jgi:hypothetical protein
MFSLCENMKWAHLPLAGGLYDQSPELLDKFMYIFQQRAVIEAEEARKREREAKSKSPSRPSSRRRG